MQDNIEKDAWLEEFFPRQMEVYHNAIEQISVFTGCKGSVDGVASLM